MPESNLPLDVSVERVKELLDRGADLVLIDCRRPEEHQIASISQARLIPMDELPDRLDEIQLEKRRHVVVHCHHGGRSQRVVLWLRQQGLSDCQSMDGGIDAWSERIDASVPRY